MLNKFFKIKKQKKLNKTSFQESEKNTFKNLDLIIKDHNLIKNICELNYQIREFSKNDISYLQSIEKSLNHKFIDKLSLELNNHLNKKQLYGYRFKYNNETWDIFSDNNEYVFLGKSPKANHEVFTYNHNYDGEILIQSKKIEYKILFEIISERLFDVFLRKKTESKYSINLIENYILTSGEN